MRLLAKLVSMLRYAAADPVWARGTFDLFGEFSEIDFGGSSLQHCKHLDSFESATSAQAHTVKVAERDVESSAAAAGEAPPPSPPTLPLPAVGLKSINVRGVGLSFSGLD